MSTTTREEYIDDVQANVEAHQARKAGAVEDAAPPEKVTATAKPDHGSILILTYSVLPGRRQEFLDLMAEARPLVLNLLRKSGGGSYSLVEDTGSEGRFLEILQFNGEGQRVAFDDAFHKDRKLAALNVLLDDIVDAARSDYRVFVRRL